MTFESEYERRWGELWDALGLLAFLGFLMLCNCF